MRLLICGSRDWTNKERVFEVVRQHINAWANKYAHEFKDTEIIEGACPTGADHFARDFARDNELVFINVPARWTSQGLAAGPIRNRRMLDDYEPDLVIGFHNDIKNSKGTKHMLDIAVKDRIDTLLVTDTMTKWLYHDTDDPDV